MSAGIVPVVIVCCITTLGTLSKILLIKVAFIRFIARALFPSGCMVVISLPKLNTFSIIVVSFIDPIVSVISSLIALVLAINVLNPSCLFKILALYVSKYSISNPNHQFE